jgi:hypothetical protein
VPLLLYPNAEIARVEAFDRLRLPGDSSTSAPKSRIASFRFFSDDHHSTVSDISVIHHLHGRAWPKVKPRRGEENEQTNDTGRNRTPPAKQACSNLGQGCIGWGRVRPMSPAEHSRRSRARQRDDEIVRFRFGTLAAPSMAPCEMVSMSALGQKRTCATHKLMSALPPKATSNAT